MSRLTTPRNPSSHYPASLRAEVLKALDEITSSPQFCNSKRYPALLRYVVLHTLAGRGELLKERTIGIEVFEKSADYDTGSDTVVRYTAGEVRKRLMLYYSERGAQPGVRISLPSGSYIPEFIHEASELSAVAPAADEAAAGVTTSEEPNVRLNQTRTFSFSNHIRAAALLCTVVIVGALLTAWKLESNTPEAAYNRFWKPVLSGQNTVTLCTGGVVFKTQNFSGVMTAPRDTDYPFLSMQIAASIAQISELTHHFGAAPHLISSPSTQLDDLRGHPVVLIGGYNNKWSMRLLANQRYYFTREPLESIADNRNANNQWMRDRSIPYGSADDFALVARFRDPTSGSWIVVLAGLGRNGTEAATQFATSPTYLAQLEQHLGRHMGSGNVEAVLRVRVVDGKTGAPTLVAADVW